MSEDRLSHGVEPAPALPAVPERSDPPRWRSRAALYAAAVLLPLTVLALRVSAAAWVGERPLLVAFFIPILLCAYLGGLGPGLVSALVSAAGTFYFLVPTTPAFPFGRPIDVLQWGIFVLTGMLVSGLSEAVHRLRRKDAATIGRFREAQRALQENEELFTKTFRLSPDCLVIVRLSDRTVVRANDALCRLWGCTAAEIIGQPTKNYTNWVSEEKREGFVRTLRERGEVPSYESTVQLNGGRTVTLLVSARLIMLGGEECVLSVMHDVTARKHAEDERRRMEERYTTLFDYAPDGIVIADAQSTYIDGNASICRMLGYTREELVGRNAADIVMPSEIPHIEPALASIEERAHHQRIWRFRRKDGSAFEAEVLATKMPDGNLLGVIRDITERRQRESLAAQLVAIVASSDDAIIGMDLRGVVTSWNAAAERILGYTAGEMNGQPILRVVPPERRHEEVEILARIARGESLRHFDTKRLRKDGGTIDLSLTVSPIRDAAGRIVGASKVARDVTAQKRVNDALAAERTLLRTLFDLLPDYIYVKDRESRFLACNDRCAQRFGLASTAELIGKTDADFFSPEMSARFRAEELNIMAGQPLIDREEPFVRADGVREIILTSKLPLRDGTGQVIGIIGCGHDITKRKRDEEAIQRLNEELEGRVKERTSQLEGANKELEAFSYSVSHDLRAPLRAVDGFSQAVIEDYGAQLPAEGRRQLQTIRESAQRMGALIDDLLRFSRLSRQPLSKHRVDTAKLVHSALADLDAERDQVKVQITIGELPASDGDPSLLKQAWVNLLSNALKYSRRRTPAIIEVGCVRHDGENVFFVRDNGTGFDMQYAAKLFGVFQRLHRVDEFEGTGVGLAIVHRVVTRHGGRVWCEAALERGATFYFTLEEIDPS